MRKLLKMALAGPIMAFLGLNTAFSDQIATTKFKGLNNQGNSVTIDPSEASDLLNTDVSITGQSFKKRPGYGLYKALGTAKPMHGGYHAYDSNGNDYQLWGTSTSLYGIVGDGTPTQLISSATLNSTWDCADTQQNSYCVNSNRDAFIKTNGTTLTWYTAPLGTMVESTPDRIVVAGVSGSPNTLFVSQSNTFTNFTVGVNATDAFNEVIAGPGSKITHIRWGCGKLLWWKDQSFGYFDFDDQFAAQVKTVSDVIGTFDNTSAIDPGGEVWFRGQDGHTWMYDCSILSKQSIDITPNILAAGKRTANAWTQTSQSDWQAGQLLPSANFSTTLSPGDIVLSSFTVTETGSASGWSSGTSSNFAVGTSSLSLLTNNSGNVTNPDFESSFTGNWTADGVHWIQSGSFSASCGTINPQSGSFDIKTANSAPTFEAVDLNNNLLASVSFGVGPTCTWTQYTLSVGSNLGKRVIFQFHALGLGNTHFYAKTTDSYIWGGPITLYGNNDGLNFFADNVQLGSSTITSGSFTSRIFDTGISSNVYSLSNVAWTVNTSTPTFALQTASNSTTGPWTSILTSSGTNATGTRYAQYVATISITGADNALTSITGATIVAKSTGGVFLSAVKNAPNLTGWNTLGVNAQTTGGTERYYIRSDTHVITVTQSTPSWTEQTSGSLITVATGTYFQFADTFTTVSATATLALNDFTINWFEGSASDQAYMLYFDNAIWESVAFGAGQAINNYIFKYDLINEGWTLYNFGTGGMLVQANTLYFGDALLGNVFNYGTGTSDNGTAINAFWKSKTFTGNDPFLQNQLTNIDVFAKKDQGTTLTSTYLTDTLNSTSYSISLSTSASIVQSRKLLPSGKNGYGFSLQLGDTSASSAWEVFGFRIGYLPQPYRPTVP